jgi:hypothetical protein
MPFVPPDPCSRVVTELAREVGMADVATERPVRLRSASDLPEAFGRLAVLVVNADPLGPKTASRLVGGHTRSLGVLG